jgi:hypothetical protein
MHDGNVPMPMGANADADWKGRTHGPGMGEGGTGDADIKSTGECAHVTCGSVGAGMTVLE